MKKAFVFIFLSFSSLFASMQYFPGEGKEVLLGKEGDIRLLTWNVLGLPNIQVAIRQWQRRVDGIAQKILSIDAEVVVLQECFVKGLSLGLYERLKGRYAHVYLHLKDSSTFLPSGLALFSKLPISDFRFSPHPDLLDTERYSKMGTIDFTLLNEEQAPIAHIAASHFQGSSNCEWRVGVTKEGRSLSYAEVREQETNAVLNLSKVNDIPHYLCGDLNVDRRSREFDLSGLNAALNFNLTDAMTPSMKLEGTNTNFWKHAKGLSQMHPTLSQDQTIILALQYKQLYEEKLKDLLSKDPWDKMVSDFDPSFFSALEKELKLDSPEKNTVWRYFKNAAIRAIAQEKRLWKKNRNQGDAPSVSIGRILEIRVLPIEESLDYILGLNRSAAIKEITILKGYDNSSPQNTLSDHHPLLAIIRVAQSDNQAPD